MIDVSAYTPRPSIRHPATASRSPHIIRTPARPFHPAEQAVQADADDDTLSAIFLFFFLFFADGECTRCSSAGYFDAAFLPLILPARFLMLRAACSARKEKAPRAHRCFVRYIRLPLFSFPIRFSFFSFDTLIVSALLIFSPLPPPPFACCPAFLSAMLFDAKRAIAGCPLFRISSSRRASRRHRRQPPTPS